MSKHEPVRLSIFSWELVGPAIANAFTKLDPRQLIHNPVMFTTAVVALLLTGGSLGVLHWLKPDATVADELWTTTLSGLVATAVRFTLLRHWIFRRARHR